MITEQEAREAASRVCEMVEDRDAGEVGVVTALRVYGTADIEMAARLARRDVDKVVTWMCDELSRRESEKAERAKPIDAEWLSTCKPDLLFWQKTSEFIEYEFRHQPQPGALKVVVNANGHVGFVVNKSLAACLTTRGQLLDLLAALKGGA